ncbi:methionyl-tRNA formyltransferase [Hydrogenophaga sp. 5NK40-0174]|uniref:methionyl-tRNA formyltransferase n=1 Tax=Hydrogenophaga sp. 5NK40-0174 TaxID=3127649 RepID=UPI00310687DE
MRLIFAGTPEFARVALEQLHQAGHEIALVLTQPDRPAGRGMKLQASAVKQYAVAHGMPVAQPRSLRLDGKFADDAAAGKAAIEAAKADAMVVAAYGLILPQWVLDTMAEGGRAHGLAGLGCFNIHASLLPRWRGAAPIHRAIEAGDAETGVTIMQMDAGLDTGDMLLVRGLPIDGQATTGSLHDQLADVGGQMMVEALILAADGALAPKPQPAEGVTYASKIDKAEAEIDWSQSADVIERRVRAFNPFPAATTHLGEELIKVWQAEKLAGDMPDESAPGAVLQADASGIVVQTGQGQLRLTELQRAGAKRMPADAFLRGFALTTGQVLSSPSPGAVAGS